MKMQLIRNIWHHCSLVILFRDVRTPCLVYRRIYKTDKCDETTCLYSKKIKLNTAKNHIIANIGSCNYNFISQSMG